MARRKQGAADGGVDLVARLPWWGGVALALLSYVILHRMAMQPTQPLQPGQMAAFMQQSVLGAVAQLAQYVVPFLCLLGALVSFLQRRKRQALLATVTQSGAASALNDMSWHEFEMLVGEAFRRQGYEVTEQGGAGPDGGVDLTLRRGSESFLVQCKQWKAFKVGVDVVRSLYGVMAARGAAGGFVITSGSFTADAQEFARGRHVRLVDGPQLMRLVQSARASVSTRKSPASPRPVAAAAAEPAAAASPDGSASARPNCPLCASAMVRRTAKKGAHAGRQFWGCVQFPTCRGVR